MIVGRDVFVCRIALISLCNIITFGGIAFGVDSKTKHEQVGRVNRNGAKL